MEHLPPPDLLFGIPPDIESIRETTHRRVIALLPPVPSARRRSWKIPIIALLPAGMVLAALALTMPPDSPKTARFHDAAQSSALSQSSETGTGSSSVLSLDGAGASQSGSAVFSSADASSPSGSGAQHLLSGVRGVYLSALSTASSRFFAGTIDSLLSSGGNAIVVDVKGHHVYFDTHAPMAKALGLVDNDYDLKEIVAKAAEKHIEVIARYVAVSDKGITAAKPETRVKNPKTGEDVSPQYIDPSNPLALEYNSEILCDVASSGVAEINLDYIRFSTADFTSLRLFTGKEKADKVEKFIKMARETIDWCGPHVRLGISTFAILGWDYAINLETLGQDVVRFAPLVDIISPMAYPQTFAEGSYYDPKKNPGSRMYYLVWRTLQGYKQLLGDQAWKLRPWLQAYNAKTQDVRDQLKAVYDNGLCGFQFWNAGNGYSTTYEGMKDWKAPAACGGAVVGL